MLTDKVDFTPGQTLACCKISQAMNTFICELVNGYTHTLKRSHSTRTCTRAHRSAVVVRTKHVVKHSGPGVAKSQNHQMSKIRYLSTLYVPPS